MDENKKRALDAAILKIEKDFGKGAVMRLGNPNAMGNVEVVPTGALSLDIALGLGGIPKGRVVEVYGPERCTILGGSFNRGKITNDILQEEPG